MSSPDGWAALLRAARAPSTIMHRDDLVASAMELAGDVTPHLAGCSMTVGDPDGGWNTPHASRLLALTLDHAQYRAGTGPCVEAAVTAQAVQLDSIAADGRFVDFADAAAAHGVSSSLSLPLGFGRSARCAQPLRDENCRVRQPPSVPGVEPAGAGAGRCPHRRR